MRTTTTTRTRPPAQSAQTRASTPLPSSAKQLKPEDAALLRGIMGSTVAAGIFLLGVILTQPKPYDAPLTWALYILAACLPLAVLCFICLYAIPAFSRAEAVFLSITITFGGFAVVGAYAFALTHFSEIAGDIFGGSSLVAVLLLSWFLNRDKRRRAPSQEQQMPANSDPTPGPSNIIAVAAGDHEAPPAASAPAHEHAVKPAVSTSTP